MDITTALQRQEVEPVGLPVEEAAQADFEALLVALDCSTNRGWTTRVVRLLSQTSSTSLKLNTVELHQSGVGRLLMFNVLQRLRFIKD